MHTIEVDFEVYKQLTVRRSTEDVSYNDVIRELLGLEQRNAPPEEASLLPIDVWVVKGVSFPAGTEFRANYKGQTFTARVEGGNLILKGVKFSSPSAAAISITKTSVNGWRFWECRFPGKSAWQLMESLRR
jgi:hypothetical protein